MPAGTTDGQVPAALVHVAAESGSIGSRRRIINRASRTCCLCAVMDRWPTFHKPALRWTERVERAIAPGITQYQFKNGADPETARLLLVALANFASSCGISPAAIGLDSEPAAALASLAPSGNSPR